MQAGQEAFARLGRVGRRGGKMVAILAVALLAACGGGGSGGGSAGGGGTGGGSTGGGTTTGGSTTGGTTGGEGATGLPGVHMAGLGPLAGSRVHVEALNAPGLSLAETTTDGNGRFSLALPSVAAFDDSWVLVIVDGGNDTDADADGVPDATPTPFNGALRALVKARWLRERSIAVSALSDALYLSVAGAFNDVPVEAIRHALDRSAYLMLKADFDGDSAISYDDVLSFNASRAGDQARLDFDYAATVLGPQSSDGTSLAAKYHRGEGTILGPAVDEAFGRMIKPTLPPPESLPTVAVTIKAGLGGSVRSPGLGNTEIGGSFGTFVHRMDRTADPLIVTATADPGFLFSRWVGCPELIPGEPQSCRILPNDRHVVTAQFAVAERRLAAGVTGEVVLDVESGRISVSFVSATDLVLTTLASDTATRAVMEGIAVGNLVYTGLGDRPQVKVSQRISRTVIPGPTPEEDLFQKRYRVADVKLADAYDAVSFALPEDPLTLDDLTAITVADPATGNVRTVKLAHPLMRGYVPGPGPSAAAAARACPGAGREAVWTYAADGSGKAATTCLEAGARPAQPGASCPATERTVDLVDGRRYCVIDGSWDTAHDRHARELAAQLAQATPAAGLVKVSRALTPVAPTRTGPRVQQAEFAREVFLAGYGRALDLGHGQYLTNNPEARGLSLIEIDGKPEVIADRRELRRTIAATCRLNRFASGCVRRSGGGLVKTQTIDPFPPLPGGDGFQAFSLQDIEISFTKAPALKIVVKIQVNIDARNSGGGSYSAPLAGEVRMSGNVTVTPSLGVKLILGFGKDLLERSGKPKAGGGEKTEAKKLLFSIDFAKYIPKVGAVMQGDIDFQIGVDLNGSIELDNKLQVPVITRYDIDVAVGLRCAKTVDLLLFEVPIADCTTTSRFDVVVRPTVQYRYRMQGVINATLEPYAEVAVTAGIKGGFERMAKVAARGFVQAEAILQSPIIQATNIPQIIAEQGGKRTCVDGTGEARINLWYGYRVYGRVTTEDTLIGKILILNREFPFAEQKWPIANWGWDPATGEKLDPPKAVSVGLFINPVNDEPEPCTGGTRPKATERVFRAGTLELQDGSFIATTTRKLVMQRDGNLVMYDYDAENAKENAALFASGTNGTSNLRALFQSDGNLVLYNLRDQAVWRSGTFGYPNAVLTLKENGEVQILRADGDRPVWGQSLSYRNAGLTMRLGDRLLTPDRELVFQAHDGNLVLYRLENGFQREALWSSGTNGMALGPTASVLFQQDGNLVVYDNNDRARWASNSNGQGGNELRLQRDGNLVIYAPDERAIWSTNTRR